MRLPHYLALALVLSACGAQEPKTPDDVAAIVDAVGKVSCKDLLANTLENPPSDVVRRARTACKALPYISALINGG